MRRTGGYTHGMFTLRVPPELAVPLSRDAREFGVSFTSLLLMAIKIAVDDPDYVTEVLIPCIRGDDPVARNREPSPAPPERTPQ